MLTTDSAEINSLVLINRPTRFTLILIEISNTEYEDASIQVRQASREMRYITNPPCMSIPNALGPRHQTKATSVTPRAPSWIHLPPCTSYRCIHTDVRYILQRHCSRIVIRHMHAWSTYRITGSRSQTEVRTCFLLALLLYLPISKDSDANQITVQNFIYFPDTYVYRSTEYIMHGFSCYFFSFGGGPGAARWWVFHPPLDSISQRFEGKSSASKRKEYSGDNWRYFFLFLFILFNFLWMWIWDEELIYPTEWIPGYAHDSPVAALHMYTP